MTWKIFRQTSSRYLDVTSQKDAAANIKNYEDFLRYEILFSTNLSKRSKFDEYEETLNKNNSLLLRRQLPA